MHPCLRTWLYLCVPVRIFACVLGGEGAGIWMDCAQPNPKKMLWVKKSQPTYKWVDFGLRFWKPELDRVLFYACFMLYVEFFLLRN